MPQPALPAGNTGDDEDGERNKSDGVTPGETRHAFSPEILVDLVENIDHVCLRQPIEVCAQTKEPADRRADPRDRSDANGAGP
jgi:hypothetical protein